MIWLGRDIKIHLVPKPCHRLGHFPPNQIAQAPSNSPVIKHKLSFQIGHTKSQRWSHVPTASKGVEICFYDNNVFLKDLKQQNLTATLTGWLKLMLHLTHGHLIS